MRLVVLILGLFALTACTELQTATDSAARSTTKGVVAEVLATRFPQVPKEQITPFTDCIIDNSTAEEVQEYVKAAVRGVDEGTVNAVRTALLRRETVNCLGGSLGVLG